MRGAPSLLFIHMDTYESVYSWLTYQVLFNNNSRENMGVHGKQFFSNSSTISSPQCKLLFSLSELFSCYLLFVMSCVRLYSLFVSVYCTTLLSSLFNSFGTVMSNLWVILRFSQDLLTSMKKAMDTLPCSHGNG